MISDDGEPEWRKSLLRRPHQEELERAARLEASELQSQVQINALDTASTPYLLSKCAAMLLMFFVSSELTRLCSQRRVNEEFFGGGLSQQQQLNKRQMDDLLECDMFSEQSFDVGELIPKQPRALHCVIEVPQSRQVEITEQGLLTVYDSTVCWLSGWWCWPLFLSICCCSALTIMHSCLLLALVYPFHLSLAISSPCAFTVDALIVCWCAHYC